MTDVNPLVFGRNKVPAEWALVLTPENIVKFTEQLPLEHRAEFLGRLVQNIGPLAVNALKQVDEATPYTVVKRLTKLPRDMKVVARSIAHMGRFFASDDRVRTIDY